MKTKFFCLVLLLFFSDGFLSAKNVEVPSFDEVQKAHSQWRRNFYKDFLVLSFIHERSQVKDKQAFDKKLESGLSEGLLELVDELKKLDPKTAPLSKEEVDKIKNKVLSLKEKKVLSQEDIQSIFENSLEPQSKAVALVSSACKTFERPPDPIPLNQCGLVFYTILGAEIKGSGGFYQKGSDQGLAVYTQVSKDGPYSKNEVPPPGQLVRDQYPFLVFSKVNGQILLNCASSEFGKVIDFLFNQLIS